MTNGINARSLYGIMENFEKDKNSKLIVIPNTFFHIWKLFVGKWLFRFMFSGIFFDNLYAILNEIACKKNGFNRKGLGILSLTNKMFQCLLILLKYWSKIKLFVFVICPKILVAALNDIENLQDNRFSPFRVKRLPVLVLGDHYCNWFTRKT